MPWIDARIPLRFGTLGTRTPGDAVLLDSDAPAPQPHARFTSDAGPHAPGCTCCPPRTAAAQALAGLFRARALGASFDRVLACVTPEGAAAIETALRHDPVASARFRLG